MILILHAKRFKRYPRQFFNCFTRTYFFLLGRCSSSRIILKTLCGLALGLHKANFLFIKSGNTIWHLFHWNNRTMLPLLMKIRIDIMKRKRYNDELIISLMKAMSKVTQWLPINPPALGTTHKKKRSLCLMKCPTKAVEIFYTTQSLSAWPHWIGWLGYFYQAWTSYFW